MLDAGYEDSLAAYLVLCDRHEKTVEQLMHLANDGRHSEFKTTARLARVLAVEMDTLYVALRAQRHASVQP